MSYHEVSGDLFQTNDTYIMHGCNCQGVMGAGVALQIKKRWPEVYESYRRYCDTFTPEEILGSVHAYKTNDKKHIILNAFTQLKTGSRKQVSYDAIDEVTRYVNTVAPVNSYISMPAIGSGLAGGDWGIIRHIIQRNMRDVNVTVYFL